MWDVGATALGLALADNNTLCELLLGSNGITSTGVTALVTPLIQAGSVAAASHLTVLRLFNNTVKREGCQAVRDLLLSPACPHLQHLTLQAARIGNRGAAFLAQGLQTNTTLRSLQLNDNHIGVAGGEAIGTSLRVNTTLIELSLADNPLGLGVQAIASALSVSRLAELDLSSTKLGSEKMATVAHALKSNTVLTALNISHNAAGQRGAEALAAMLPHNKTLKTLDLSFNGILDNGAATLAAVTQMSLSDLDLSGNGVGEPGARAFALRAHWRALPKVASLIAEGKAEAVATAEKAERKAAAKVQTYAGRFAYYDGQIARWPASVPFGTDKQRHMDYMVKHLALTARKKCVADLNADNAVKHTANVKASWPNC
jgi:Ran GTPase-activating protein (RanGAP) involved in mRNA processing and transport